MPKDLCQSDNDVRVDILDNGFIFSSFEKTHQLVAGVAERR